MVEDKIFVISCVDFKASHFYVELGKLLNFSG